MTPVHHPVTATLMAYAGGTLAPGIAAAVSAHVRCCADCRAELPLLEMVGAVLLEDIAAMPLTGRFAVPGQPVCACKAAAVAARLTPAHQDLRAMVRRFTGPEIERIPWRRLVPGVRQFQVLLPGGGAGSLRFFKLGPGQQIPEHGHRGAEVTFVMTGAYQDCAGRFGPGDLADLDGETVHAPVADHNEGCICLAATENPRQYKSPLPRKLRPLDGI